MREALFSIWNERLRGCRFLDLFAGSGAVGIEALSRGAEFALLIEGNSRRFRALVDNLKDLDLGNRCEARQLELPRELGRLPTGYLGSFDLIFADPPYAFKAIPKLVDRCDGLLAPGGEIAVEHARRGSFLTEDAVFATVDERTYGESAVTFFRRLPTPRPTSTSC